jgi:hypothetical protein
MKLPAKLHVFQRLYGLGQVNLHIDARRPEVVVPDKFRSNHHLVLTYGANMAIPIVDLQLTKAGISATLSLDQQPCFTFIPWEAVYCVNNADGLGVLYKEEVPNGIKSTAEDLTPEELAALKDEAEVEQIPLAERITPTERSSQKSTKVLLS